MEEGEKGLLMGAAIFSFLAAAMLASSFFAQAEDLQKSTYDRNLWKRNVVIIGQDWISSEMEMEGREYG